MRQPSPSWHTSFRLPDASRVLSDDNGVFALLVYWVYRTDTMQCTNREDNSGYQCHLS